MMERPMREDPGWRARDAKALGDGIRSVLKRLDMGSRGWLEQVACDWAEIAGAEAAAHTRPGRLERDALVVFVDSSVWMDELSRRGRHALLQNILRRPDTRAVKRLIFRLDPDPRR